MYVIEGLARARLAIITKTHFAMIDSIGALDVAQVLLDVTPTPRETPQELWMPRPEPGAVKLVLDAATEAGQRPAEVVENVRAAALDAAATARKVATAFGGVFSAVRTAMWAAPGSPLNVPISTHRRFAVARASLDDFKLVRKAHGGTINDVVLAVVAGALRNWLLSRGEAVTASTTIRALTPVSVRGSGDGGAPGDEVSPFLVDLPVGEPNPVVRLHHVSHAMRGHADSGQSVAASTLIRLGGFAPPTLHALGARVANGFAQRIYNLVVTNVPGPQFPLYAAGARMLEIFPVVPLAKNQGLSIGVNSYDGGVYFGLNADRDAVADVDVLAGLLGESLEELAGTVP
jgi:WS/DGAT/MGAT family acyltransferase